MNEYKAYFTVVRTTLYALRCTALLFTLAFRRLTVSESVSTQNSHSLEVIRHSPCLRSRTWGGRTGSDAHAHVRCVARGHRSRRCAEAQRAIKYYLYTSLGIKYVNGSVAK